MSRHPHVLEFVGLPGAGKTTLARRLTAGLAAEGIRCAAPRLERIDVPARGARRFARGAHRVATYAATPVLSATVLRFGFSIRPLRPARAKWLRDVLDTVRGVASSAPDRELILLDQGVLQALWSASLAGTLPPPAVVGRLVRRSTAAYGARVAFLYLEVDTATAVSRIAGRSSSKSRFDRLPSQQTARLLTDELDRLERILTSTARATCAPVLRLDGRAPVDDLCARSIEFVLEWLARRGTV